MNTDTMSTSPSTHDYADVSDDILAEVFRAKRKYPRSFNSAHEGYAVVLEEMDELKAHVWAKQSERDLVEMRKEAIQAAAMLLRFAAECCGPVKGRI